MNKTEYWFLNLVVEGQHRLKILNHPEIELATNRRTHGLPFEELAETIYRLCQQGDITTGINEREVQLSLAGIEAGLSGQVSVWYGLTAQGGAKWEEYSNPNRDRYVDAWFAIDPHEGEITATTRDLVEKSLAYQPAFDQLIIKGSETWEVLSPWQATYWKVLPIGYRVKFEYMLDEKTSWEPSELHLLDAKRQQQQEYWKLAKWYTSFLTDNS